MSLSALKNLLAQYLPIGNGSTTAENEKYTRLSSMSDNETDVEMATSPTPSDDSRTRLNPQEEPRETGSALVDARVVSDAIIGLSDGLTVPFALTAGLSTLEDTKVVVFGGLAELIAGAISMGLGGYLGAKSEEESYRATLKKTTRQIATDPSAADSMIADIFAPYDLPPQVVSDLARHLADSPRLHTFLMNFHHSLPEPSGSRALTCAITIALGYFLGGFVPLLPYFFVGPHEAFYALKWSIATMAVALFAFGYVKTCYVCGWKGRQNVRQGLYGALQMVLVGGTAAGAAMGLVKLFQVLADGTGEDQNQ
ncbi:hypothetical protein VTN49DRAFT_1266 [Thermomyces lanuginosus]|uniref:uncharacterized protein n=1 Tax=Thermomyces lanuginosus TaxID=5541 RepID=UPI003742DD4D